METAAAAEDWQKEIAERFEEAMRLFENQDWTAAAKAFREITAVAPADNPSQFYLRRCEDYEKNPPGKTWDGVLNLAMK
jgi:adenylate cyclase